MIKSVIALAVSIVVVHLFYIGYIRPEAAVVIEIAQANGQAAPRDLVVILKDFEQEICVILMLWGIYLIGSKCYDLLKDRYLFKVDLLEGTAQNGTEGESAGGADAGAGPGVHGSRPDIAATLKTLEALPDKVRDTPLVRTLTASMRRYLITGNVQDTSEAIQAGVEALALKQETENSMIRYLIWAIPSIGFLGTVRGIGTALSQAEDALAGDITGMTASLGIAFNSTLVALLISVGLMFLLHQLQRLQDGLVVETQEYCEVFLLNRISETDQP